MEPFQRGPIPARLSDPEQVAAWTHEWVNAPVDERFRWRANQSEIADAAARDTNGHCSYCDHLLPDPRTIDHLRPKATVRERAYDWENLYLCCQGCQPRVGVFTEDVLAPDEVGYRFDDFFTVDSEWRLRALDGPNSTRALKTIEHLRLNQAGRSLHFKRERAFAEQRKRPRTERDYRYLWQADQANDQGIGVSP
jgi:uncharacterized protein (TIGR02646 family)